MKSTINHPPSSPEPDAGPDKPSRAAEYIAALYVALVLLAPWLLRDAPLFAPAKGVEIQMSYKGTPAPRLELKAQGVAEKATNASVRAN